MTQQPLIIQRFHQHLLSKSRIIPTRTNKKQITSLIKKIRKAIPDVTIRTTLIVGFPGETKEDFKELEDFVKETKFDKLGAFQYSKEEGTPAAKLKEQVHPMTKKARYNKIMKLQQQVSKDNLLILVGKEEKVLIEGITFDEKYYVGRTSYQVPDIDGITYIKSDKELTIGDFVNCTIAKSKEYDLIAKI